MRESTEEKTNRGKVWTQSCGEKQAGAALPNCTSTCAPLERVRLQACRSILLLLLLATAHR